MHGNRWLKTYSSRLYRKRGKEVKLEAVEKLMTKEKYRVD
jgi:hypothetical protein